MLKRKLFRGYMVDFNRFYKKLRAVISFIVGWCMNQGLLPIVLVAFAVSYSYILNPNYKYTIMY